MNTELHPDFKKSYKKRITNNKKLAEKVEERVTLFQNDPQNPLLKDHALKGEKAEFRAFSITGNIRIVYILSSKDRAIFIDIGTHNQVY